MKLLLIGLMLGTPVSVTLADYHVPVQIQVRADGAAATQWQTLALSRIDPQRQLIWIRLRFTLPNFATSPQRPIGLYVAGAAAYEAWWNDTPLGHNGRPGRSEAEEIAGRIDSALPIASRLLRPGQNEALLKISSFHSLGRVNEPIQVLELRDFEVMPLESLRQDPFRMVAAGALLLGAVYFAALYFSDRKELSALLLALLSTTVLAQLASKSFRSFVNYAYPFHFIRLGLILGMGAASMLLLVLYVTFRYARPYVLAMLSCAVLLEIASVTLVEQFQSQVLAVLISGFLVAITAAAVGMRRRTHGAGAAMLAIITALALASTDFYEFVDRTYYVAMAGLLFVLFGQHVITLRGERKAQAETRLRAAQLELELLRQQIQPHFLMNTLTALSEWVESDPATGVRMIEALGDELRAIAVMGEATTVPLGREIELCRHHLRVMGFRRNQSFVLKTEGIDLSTVVPPALFHTLIENSLTHNAHVNGAQFKLHESGGTDGRRRYELYSNLCGTNSSTGAGKGHAYVRARLQHAFGDNWHFSSGSASAHEWVDVVEVPGK